MNSKKQIKLTEQDVYRIINEEVAKIVNGNFTAGMFRKYMQKAYECADMRNKYKMEQYFPDLFGGNYAA